MRSWISSTNLRTSLLCVHDDCWFSIWRYRTVETNKTRTCVHDDCWFGGTVQYNRNKQNENLRMLPDENHHAVRWTFGVSSTREEHEKKEVQALWKTRRFGMENHSKLKQILATCIERATEVTRQNCSRDETWAHGDKNETLSPRWQLIPVSTNSMLSLSFLPIAPGSLDLLRSLCLTQQFTKLKISKWDEVCNIKKPLHGWRIFVHITFFKHGNDMTNGHSPTQFVQKTCFVPVS